MRYDIKLANGRTLSILDMSNGPKGALEIYTDDSDILFCGVTADAGIVCAGFESPYEIESLPRRIV